MKQLEEELKQLIVSTLELEDVTPDQIDSEAPLFGEGLSLDSVDALELAMAISKKYGVSLQAEDEQTRQVFGSVRNLAGYVQENRLL